MDLAASELRAAMQAAFDAEDVELLLRRKETVDAFMTPALLLHELGDLSYPDVVRLFRENCGGGAISGQQLDPVVMGRLIEQLDWLANLPSGGIRAEVLARSFAHAGPDIPVAIRMQVDVRPGGATVLGIWYEPALAGFGLDFPVPPDDFVASWNDSEATFGTAGAPQTAGASGASVAPGAIGRGDSDGARQRVTIGQPAHALVNPTDIYTPIDALRWAPVLLGRLPAPGAGPDGRVSRVVERMPPGEHRNRIELRRDGRLLRTTTFDFRAERLVAVEIDQRPFALRHESLAALRLDPGGAPPMAALEGPIVSQRPYLGYGRQIRVEFVPLEFRPGAPSAAPRRITISMAGVPMFEAVFLGFSLLAERDAAPASGPDAATAALAAAFARSFPAAPDGAESARGAQARREIRARADAALAADDRAALRRAIDDHEDLLRRDGLDLRPILLEAELVASAAQGAGKHALALDLVETSVLPRYRTRSSATLAAEAARLIDQHRLGLALLALRELRTRDRDSVAGAWAGRTAATLRGWINGTVPPPAPPTWQADYDSDALDAILFDRFALLRDE